MAFHLVSEYLKNSYTSNVFLFPAFYFQKETGTRKFIVASNGDWWEKFHETHPEYLAKNPEGKIEQNPKRPTFFKLCISEPGVIDEIIRTWEEAGMPDYWDVIPI